jgi:putative ABC transport system permease protein
MVYDHTILALKNIRKRGVRSWLTMLGIFIGIAAVVSLISLGNGLREAITGQFSQLGSDKLVVTSAETGFGPPGASAVRPLNEHDLRLVRRIAGVDLAVPRLIRVVPVEYNKIRTYEYVASMPPTQDEIELVYDTLNVDAAEGKLLTKDDRKKVVLGSDFTDERFGRNLRIGSRVSIGGEEFQVVGFLEKANSFQINGAILMAEDDLKNIMNIGDEIDMIAVQVDSVDNVDKTANDIEKAMRRDRGLKEGEEDFAVQTPEQSLATINTTLAVINLVVVAIAAISLLVGGIGITNTMYTAVLERTKEIGVMKAIGAKNQDVLILFLAESALLGVAGGLVGVAIGLGLAFLVSVLVTAAFPGISFGVTFSLPLIVGSLFFALLVGTISGVVPALQASRMRPVEALRS